MQLPSIAMGRCETKDSPSRTISRPLETEGEKAEGAVRVVPPAAAYGVGGGGEDMVLMLNDPRIAGVKADLVVAPGVGPLDGKPAHGLHRAPGLAVGELEQALGKVRPLGREVGGHGVDAAPEVKLIGKVELRLLGVAPGQGVDFGGHEPFAELGHITFPDHGGVPTPCLEEVGRGVIEAGMTDAGVGGFGDVRPADRAGRQPVAVAHGDTGHAALGMFPQVGDNIQDAPVDGPGGVLQGIDHPQHMGGICPALIWSSKAWR